MDIRADEQKKLHATMNRAIDEKPLRKKWLTQKCSILEGI